MKKPAKKPAKKSNRKTDGVFCGGELVARTVHSTGDLPKDLTVTVKVKPSKVCAICGRDSTQIKAFNRHHLRYDPPEVTVNLCLACHQRIHGRQCYHHPFDKAYGKDLGPYVFCLAVTALYAGNLGPFMLGEMMANKEVANAANEIKEEE